MKKYISITIGRNVGEQPMPETNWKSFLWDTGRALQKRAKIDGIIFSGHGLGIWGKVNESSHAYIVLADGVDESALKADLAKLAKKYRQDAIGCAILGLPNGNESLVFSK